MSRSYRNRHSKIICRDYMKSSGHGKYWKRLSNKKMRKMEIINGSMYKKNGYTYNIHDYSVYVKVPSNWKQEKWCRYFMCK